MILGVLPPHVWVDGPSARVNLAGYRQASRPVLKVGDVALPRQSSEIAGVESGATKSGRKPGISASNAGSTA
jgi:hypothetical protein